MTHRARAVERLQENTGCSYSKACEAMEKGGGSLLEAYLFLEKSGHLPPPHPDQTFTTKQHNPKGDYSVNYSNKGSKQSITESLTQELLKNNLEIYAKGKFICGFPVVIFLIMLFSTFAGVILVMLGSMFFGISYRFSNRSSLFGGFNSELVKLSNQLAAIGNNIKK